ncbi:MAG: multiple sugar transport system substrate-binding protein [Frankiales bacterium]|nr:multiple sugar transport system substrate-binding protein [Frankiales bacterium]
MKRLTGCAVMVAATSLMLSGCGGSSSSSSATTGSATSAGGATTAAATSTSGATSTSSASASTSTSASSASPSGQASSKAPQGGGPTTSITFWNSFTSSDKPAVEALVKQFNDSGQGVKVDMTVEPFDVLTQKLLPAYAAGQGPTITTLDASQVPGIASKGVLASVDDLYGSSGLDPKTLPAASLASTMWQGKQYGVPFAAAGTMLYYNKKIFAAAGITNPPTTMDELASDAVKTTKYTSGDQTKNTYGFIVPDHAAPATWAVLLNSMGGNVVSDDGKSSEFDSPGTVKAMDFWTNLIIKNHISPAGLGGVDTDNLFAAGKAAMYINGPWASSGFKTAGIDFGVVPVPAGSAMQTCTAVSSNMHLNAKASTAQKAAAYKFFKFWNSAASQTYWAIHSAYPPNLNTVPASAIAANPTSAAFLGAKGAKFYLPGIVNATQIDSNVVVPIIQKVTEGKGTPEQLLPDASKQITALLAGQ